MKNVQLFSKKNEEDVVGRNQTNQPKKKTGTSEASIDISFVQCKECPQGKPEVYTNKNAAPKIANPAPLVHNAGSPTIVIPNIVVGLALFYGGLVQLLAGMWEFKTGNTFGATAFSSYGGFWLSFGVIFIPGFNIAGAYGDNKGQFETAALGKFTNETVSKTGGVFGIITAFIAWYCALAGLLTPENSYFTLPVVDLSRKNY
ncbi:19121_t:CDS:2 [Entrophospora sp. SA101]|nr:11726_t:CDS:2 [Entrophospora sp. SA101]CAJ0642207.1 3215_t:CDS:2 [Entrophospora sp. SA101]CAJ0762674.1 19121_t:CDS:2 [Entrophospora sp. SA101]